MARRLRVQDHAAGVAIIVAATVAHACARYSQDKVNGPRWLLLMIAAGGVVTIYFIIIPRLAVYIRILE